MLGNLTLDQLRVLVTIADAGSFSAAGRELRRAQSAISQAVATLEEAHGVTLFDRSGHRPRLTEVGRVLVGQARVVLAGADRFEAMAAAAREGVEPELAVAIDPLVPTAAFIDSLHALRAAFPHLPVSVAPLLADGRLVPLPIDDDPARAAGPLPIYAAHMRGRSLGRAGAWLLDDLKARFA